MHTTESTPQPRWPATMLKVGAALWAAAVASIPLAFAWAPLGAISWLVVPGVLLAWAGAVVGASTWSTRLQRTLLVLLLAGLTFGLFVVTGFHLLSARGEL